MQPQADPLDTSAGVRLLSDTGNIAPRVQNRKSGREPHRIPCILRDGFERNSNLPLVYNICTFSEAISPPPRTGKKMKNVSTEEIAFG